MSLTNALQSKKMLWVIVLLGTFILCLSLVTAWSNNFLTHYCSQDNANSSVRASRDCLLNYTGTYTFTNPSVWQNVPDFFYDTAIQNTYALGSEESIYINYSKPIGNNGTLADTLWTVRIGSPFYNLNISSTCLSSSSTTLELKITSSCTTSNAYWYCKNSTGYELLKSNSGSCAVRNEKINWTASDGIGNITFINVETSDYKQSRFLRVPQNGIVTHAYLNHTMNRSLNSTYNFRYWITWTDPSVGVLASLDFKVRNNTNPTIEYYDMPTVLGYTNYAYYYFNASINQSLFDYPLNFYTQPNCASSSCYLYTDIYLNNSWINIGYVFNNGGGQVIDVNTTYNTTYSMSVAGINLSYGKTNSTQLIRTSNIAQSINHYLGSCSYLNGYCYVPLNFYSDTSGIITYFDLFFDDLGFIENSQTFNNQTIESSEENFTLNMTYDSSFYNNLSVILIYNNTNYPVTTYTYGSDRVLFANVTVPVVAATNTNISFHWQIILINSTTVTYFNSTFNNQSVIKGTPLAINATCPSGYGAAFNVSFWHEQNLSSANASTIEYYLTYGIGNNNAYSINGTLGTHHQFSICINNSQPYYNVGYGEIDYGETNMVNRRYYIFGGTRITNATVNLPVYTLESADATQFLITAETPALQPYVGYYVALLRWYPSLNSYNIVDMGKTDDKGQTILNVKTLDVDYRIGVYDTDGNLIKLFNSIRMVCQTAPCTYSLIIDLNPLDLTTYQNIQSSLTFNDVTKVFTFTWNDPSQTSQTMNLTIYKIEGTSDVIVCSSTASGYTGSIICDVSAYSGTLKAQVVRTASPATIFAQLIETIKETFIDVGGGSLGLFIGVILLIFFALVGTISPIIVVILGLVALFPLALLGNISWAMFAAVGVIAGLILHFLGRVS